MTQVEEIRQELNRLYEDCKVKYNEMCDGYYEGGCDVLDHLESFIDELKPRSKVVGWVARDCNGDLNLFETKPKRSTFTRRKYWFTDSCMHYHIREDVFPDLKWEDEPKKVELEISEL